jgi:hypothetical protein
VSASSRSGRQRQLRPSRAERAPYTEALAQAVAEGRLTDELYEKRLEHVEAASTFDTLDRLVADVPFTPPRRPATRGTARLRVGRLAVAAALVGFLALGATHAIVANSGPSEAWSGADDTSAGEQAAGAGAPDGWEAPEVATEIESVDNLDDEAIAYALERAEAAELVTIERIHLTPDTAFVTGAREDGATYSVYLGRDTVGSVRFVSEDPADGATQLHPEDLDHGLDEYVEAAREAADVSGDAEVESVSVVSGDEWYTPESAGRNLVQVRFEGDVFTSVHGDDLSVIP